MLQDWDFADESANSATAQINRQKSARNLDILELDLETGMGIFYDPKRDVTSTCTLKHCDCHDFNFSGNNPRKNFKPCMHIYRLAMELGLIEAKYLDHAAQSSLGTQKRRAETDRLKQLEPDKSQWGNWNKIIHESGIQKNRQYRAYGIKYEEPNAIQKGEPWTVHEYRVSLDHCDCPDFLERRLPCKHIYVVALESSIALPFSLHEYKAAREKGQELIFAYENA
jgi:predicted nucleic acid-binding Zn finger protein